MASIHKEFGGLLDHVTAEPDATGIGTYTKPKLSTGEQLDRAQLGLDAAGMYPGIGMAADIPNSLLSLVRGNYGDFLMSLGAAIPGIGLGIGGAKIGKKAAKAADELKTGGTMPKMSEQMPTTQTYQFSNPNKFGRGNTKLHKLLDRLDSDELDAFEAMDVRRQLDELRPGWRTEDWILGETGQYRDADLGW